MNFCDVEKLSDLLTIIEPQKQIVKFLMSLRERGLSFNSIRLNLHAIYHFYEMNDVPLNKKKINMFKGEFIKSVDRAYTHDEIKKILNVSDLRMKSIILLMASSGIRIGAIPLLKLRNIQKVNSIYKITVYEGSNEEYFTFCTPECASFLDAYLQFRSQNGEKLDEDSFLIRDQFDITDLEQIRNKSKGITLNTIKVLVNTILIKSGVKSVDQTPGYSRKEVSKSHGFRKFFTTQVVNSEVNPEIREMLLGHKIGLASCYYRPTQEKMYQEYQKAFNNLTINEENRLKLKLEQRVQIEKCLELGSKYSVEEFPVSLYTSKFIGLDWGFSSSGTAIVAVEYMSKQYREGIVSQEILRVVDCHLIEKGDPNQIVRLCWDLYKKYGYMNTWFFADAANAGMINLMKVQWDESTRWTKVQDVSLHSNKIIPVSFNANHKAMLSNLHLLVSKGYVAIHPKYDKLITAMRTAYANELSLDKHQTSYDDLLGSLRLALFEVKIE